MRNERLNLFRPIAALKQGTIRRKSTWFSLWVVVVFCCTHSPTVCGETPSSIEYSPQNEEGWFREITTKAREYRRLYLETREAYEALRSSYESMLETHRDLERRLALQQENWQDAELFLQSEREAWGRLFHEDSNGTTLIETTGEAAERWYLDIPYYASSEGEEPEGSLWERIRYRYQWYRGRYEAVNAAQQQLHAAREKLRQEKKHMEKESQALREATQTPQRQWQEEQNAWERLYRE